MYSLKNIYVQEVIKAYNYDVKNGGGDNLKEASSNSNLKISVTDYRWTGNEYLNGVVHWDPYQANTFDDGLHTSPATGLEHEFDHAVDDAKYPIANGIRFDQYDKQYRNKEERRVETGSEKKTATKNTEIRPGQMRKSHDGSYYGVDDPASTTKSFLVQDGDSKDYANWKQIQLIINSWINLNPNNIVNVQ